MKVVIVTGSRHWTDRNVIRKAIEAERPDLVLHGNGGDADSFAAYESSRLGIHTAAFQALWDKLGRSAGPARNAIMIRVGLAMQRAGADVTVLAFMDLLNPTPGTSHCMERAQSRGLRVRLIEPDLLHGDSTGPNH